MCTFQFSLRSKCSPKYFTDLSKRGVIFQIKIAKTRNIRTCTLIVKIGAWIRQLSIAASSGTRLNSFRCSCSGLPGLKVKESPVHDCDKRDPIGERHMSRAIAGKRRRCTESGVFRIREQNAVKVLVCCFKK
jgi:hypothetical protein